MESSRGIVVYLAADWVYSLSKWEAAEVHIFACRHVFLLANLHLCDIIYKQEALCDAVKHSNARHWAAVRESDREGFNMNQLT